MPYVCYNHTTKGANYMTQLAVQFVPSNTYVHMHSLYEISMQIPLRTSLQATISRYCYSSAMFCHARIDICDMSFLYRTTVDLK